jgi:hypothetical protein
MKYLFGHYNSGECIGKRFELKPQEIIATEGKSDTVG